MLRKIFEGRPPENTISQANRQLPDIRFHITEDTPEKLYQAFTDRRCDAFIMATFTEKKPYPDFFCSVLCREEIFLAIPPDHPIQEMISYRASDHSPYVPVKALKNQAFYMCTQDRIIRPFSERVLKSRNIPFTVIGESTNIATAINGCLTFDALTFVPKVFMRVNPSLTYASIGRNRVFWYLQIVSGTALEERLQVLLRNVFSSS